MIERVTAVLLRHGVSVHCTLTPTAAALSSSGHRSSDLRQTAAKVGTNVVIDERVGARVAVGETVAEDAEHGVRAVLRLQSEIDEQQVRVHRKPADPEHDDDGQEHPPRVRHPPVLDALQPGAGDAVATGLHGEALPARDEIAHDQEIHGGDDDERDDVREREEGDEQRRPVTTVVVQPAEVVRRRVGRQHERLDAVERQQRRVGGQHRDPDGGNDHRDPPRCRHRPRRRPHDGHEANHGDGDQRVHGDVDRHVEDEVRQLARDIADQPVVGRIVVRDERHSDDEEQDITNSEIQQQQVYRRPHCVTRQGDVDNQCVADHTDADDEPKRHRDDDLVQDVVEQQFVVEVDIDKRHVGSDVGHRCRR